MYIFQFHSIRPSYESTQEETLEWIAKAHCKAENPQDLNTFSQLFREHLWRVGCKPDKIAKRGHVLSDFLHSDWDAMEIYRLNESSTGKNLSARSERFAQSADAVFSHYYPEEAVPPDQIIHVSCTGYRSPSSAQKIVSQRGWGAKTTVTHSYHMGCYGAFPAIRMGSGFCQGKKIRAEIVHTEICSLHFNPSLHATDQLVSQSLFADGFIKYTLAEQAEGQALRLLSLHEEILPDSVDSMTWHVAHWGFQMSLSKDIPVRIAHGLKKYLKALCEEASLPETIMQNAFFAIHPGGPRILQQIQERLFLGEAQIAHSFAILQNYGNMSSATLPHIWKAILEDPKVPEGALLVSLAFGPGLTISGSLMEKVCGS